MPLSRNHLFSDLEALPDILLCFYGGFLTYRFNRFSQWPLMMDLAFSPRSLCKDELL